MDQAMIQARLDAGYGRAAARLGASCAIYRPDAHQAAIPAMDARWNMGSVAAWFGGDANFALVRPRVAEKPQVYVAVDRSVLQAGDYLLDPEGNTYFLGSMQPLMATPAIWCNRALTLQRPSIAPGANFYGGNAAGNIATLLTAWPGFVAARTRGIEPEGKLPVETRLGATVLYLPPTPGVEILPNDILADDQADPMRYTVTQASGSDWGWIVEAYDSRA